MDSESKLNWKDMGGWYRTYIGELKIAVQEVSGKCRLYYVVSAIPEGWKRVKNTYPSIEAAKADAYRQYVVWRLSDGH